MQADTIVQESARMLRLVRPAASNTRTQVYEDVLAECLYETLVLTERLPDGVPEWSRLDEQNKDRLRLMTRAFLNGLDPEAVRQAELRQREQMALNGWQMDYSRLPQRYQNRINFLIRDANTTRDHALQGVFSPLPVGSTRRAELEPERRVS